MKICERIGICKVDADGNIVELQREFFSQGWVSKDWKAFQNRPDSPVTFQSLMMLSIQRNDFMALCNGQEEIAEELFYEMDW